MFRLFLVGCLVLNCLWAKNPYHIAVCGMSRSSEELELALEFSDGVLVKKCQDKKLDASIKIVGSKIEAYGSQKIIFSQKRSGLVVTERQAKRFVSALIARLSKPAYAQVSVGKPPLAIGEGKIKSEEPVAEIEALIVETVSVPEEIPVPETPITYKFESLASIDQWTYEVSTKAYPGIQIGTQIELPGDWVVQAKSAFGTSAFQLGENIAWNQQVFFAANAGKKFEIGDGFSVMPKAGYLFWGSFSGTEQLPSFNRHDLELGAELIYLLSEPKIEFRVILSALPVNLGLQSFLIARYYFVPNWFASAQAGSVALWAHGSASTFLSASLGLGLVL
ncbi:MAG: hypothetical protein WCK49_01745 [Myxococcaceae bacterium]